MNTPESLGVPQGHDPPSNVGSPDVSTAIERLLARPELLASVASAIGLGKTPSEPPAPTTADTAAPPSPAENTPTETSPTQALGDSVAALAPLLSALSGKGSSPKSDDPRACLLCALKPYVSRGRAEAIDTIINLSRVSELLKTVDLTRRS